MNAIDEIQAAIDKLTKLRDDSIPGPWEGWKQYSPLRGTHYGIEARMVAIAATYLAADTELIETLHRTIDAQLAILEWALDVHSLRNAKHPSRLESRGLNLARAINGGTN